MKRFANRGLRSGGLRVLQPVLAEWQKINYQAGKEWVEANDDAPWWYNERASLSYFAGAVWHCKEWALEEFSSDKRMTSKGRTRMVAGRCDILFGVRQHTFIAEAKQCWPNLNGSRGIARREIELKLRLACRECRRIPTATTEERLGIVFASPRLIQSKKKELDNYLQDFLAECLAVQNASIAWAFPPQAHHLVSEINQHIYPGIVLFVRRA